MVRSNTLLPLLAGVATLAGAVRTPKKTVPGAYIVEFADDQVLPPPRPARPLGD
jgi:hypothetical protein